MLKEGDSVVIYRPENRDEYPFWISDMDRFDGVEAMIRDINSVKRRTGIVHTLKLYGIEYWFNLKWVKQIPDAEEDIIKEDIFSLIE